MSSDSSEHDGIPVWKPYEEEDTILYEPNNAFFQKVNAAPETSNNEEQQKTLKDVLTHCQVIHDAIQNLDKKFDVIHGKVSKIQRHRVKPLWQNRKPYGYVYKKYNHRISKKIKRQKMKKKGARAVFNHPESHGLALPRAGKRNDPQPTFVGEAFQLDAPVEIEQPVSAMPDQGFLQNSPPGSVYSVQSYGSFFMPDDAGPSFRPCFPSPRAHDSSHIFSPTRPTVSLSDDNSMLPQDDCSQQSNSDIMENTNTGHHTLCISNFVANSPAKSDFSDPNQTYGKDPSIWTVEDVIRYIRKVDPQIALTLSDVFIQHEIDGRALLLLKSDTMMKYMGLKLGTAVKLCYYIERLKQDNYLNH
ncbi:sex comb on midleg-like protein 1 isoform X2 [Echinops telfairi]|uniref:Sex comb on midleg-like protein 1 isoform X2 n=2 Tax=Echinops telfairi TaxID=9371 RepID=A0AC55D4K6_ECHTE|nr:sex comb on midleg-like protein 1 isoform X2 [Echinops telfairi]XP_045146657.1 sex comb on midleg-like protein 1 isoform X2 [Echinops telfairi]